MKIRFFSFLLICFILSIFTPLAFSNSVEVIEVNVQTLKKNQYRFEVTLQHDDTGWEHYANRWEVLDTKGNILAVRTLHHPHVNEQPFTRSLTVTMPEHIKTVIIRGHDSEHKYGSKEVKVSLP
ncbi:MAG: hypothetical protein OQL19_06135 [Gammaproteobacteria bacterium]|nr:hypothetical protein [Gammaproteobacteria bacterium]